MEFRRVWTLGGPNYWANFPVLEAEVDLGEWKDRSSEEIPGFNERLKAWLPSLIEHRCSVGERGGFYQRLERGTYLAHILEHVTLELQTLAGSNCGFGRARELEQDGVYRVAIQFEEESLGRECLEAGRALCMAAVLDRPFDVTATIERLKELSYDVRLGPSTAGIVRAAKGRGIPSLRLNQESLVQLGHAAQARRICTAETDRTSAIAETVAQDKELTRRLLRAGGVPVPWGRPVTDADDAWRAALDLGLPVVVKPRYGNHGRGVATNLRTQEQVRKAYAVSRDESRHVMVEQFIEGEDHRLLVIGDRLIAAAIRHPAHVVGNGRSTVRELVAEVNQDPRRSDGHSTVLSFIKLDAIGLEVLTEQGFSPDSVPPEGTKVLIRRNGNLSTGGTATDVTDRVHPEVAARAVEAARIVGLDIAGVDVVARDISLSLEEQRGGIVEVNAGPGLRMHIEPTAGQPQPVGLAIVDLLFPPGANGRIPTIGISGNRGADEAARWLAAILGAQGHVVGRVDSDGLSVGDRLLRDAAETEYVRTRDLLVNPSVTAAVCVAGAEGLFRHGFGVDRCAVGVVTWLGPDDRLELFGMETVEKYARMMRTVVDIVLPEGTAVLNADDPLVLPMREKCKGRVLLFSRVPDSRIVAEHVAAGGRAVVWKGGQIALVEAGAETPILASHVVAALTATGDSALDGLLAAVGAAVALDCRTESIRGTLLDRR